MERSAVVEIGDFKIFFNPALVAFFRQKTAHRFAPEVSCGAAALKTNLRALRQIRQSVGIDSFSMFQSAFQDGACVEVFSPAGNNPAADWKLTGKVGRLYDKGVKGCVRERKQQSGCITSLQLVL